MAEAMARIAIPFATDDGSEIETVWARPLGGDRYVIDSIPFYAKGVSLGDTVVAAPNEGIPVFTAVVSSSGHSTVRVLIWNRQDVDSVCEKFVELGCDYEGSDTPGLIAFDVPPQVAWSHVQRLLRSLCNAGAIDYEEAAISRQHVP